MNSHLQKIRRDPAFALGAILIGCLLLVALTAPFLAPATSQFSPFSLKLDASNLPPGSPHHFLGTDNLGRDLFGVAAWGARTSLAVGICSALTAVLIGSVWGASAALAGGLIEAALMRTVDVLLAVPSIVLLLVIDAVVADLPIATMLPAPIVHFLGISSHSNGLLPLFTIVIVISATTWLEAARIVRSRVQVVMSEEYVLAAQSVGLTGLALVSKHLLPNATNVIFLEATLLVADAILIEAGLSFLGLGLGPSTPSWGSMLMNAQANLIQGNWWSVFLPGMLIAVTVLAIQLVTQELAK